MKEVYHSRVYTDRPPYADFDAPAKFQAIDDLEKIRPFEPNVVKAAWAIFGKSYEYRRKYNEYKEKRKAEEAARMAADKRTEAIPGQISLLDEEPDKGDK